jgi:hypothetical protein
MHHKATSETVIRCPTAFAQGKPSMELELEWRKGVPDVGSAKESNGPMK